MTQELKVWDNFETVTVLAGKEPRSHRVTWHAAHGDESFIVKTKDGGDTVDELIIKELRKRSSKKTD